MNERRPQEAPAPGSPDDDLRTQETLAPSDPREGLRSKATSAPDEHPAPENTTVRNDTPPVKRSSAPLPALGPESAPVDTHATRSSQEMNALDEPQPGMKVAKYELIRELGRGGMGSVFLARDTRLGRCVALKFLRVQNPALAALFIVEARTTAQCNHENIVVLHEADEFQGTPYMVLEYLQGKSLAQLLDEQRSRRGPECAQLLPVARAVELIAPVLRALERAHGMGIVHRDLKPANVMLTDEGTVKVLDFGIAQVLAREADEGEPGQDAQARSEETRAPQGLAGTLPYMSPEQLRAEPVDARTDIWAIGIMLYEMVTGQHPIGQVSPLAMDRMSRMHTPMPRVSEMRPDLGEFGAIIDRCLIKHVDDRTASASALLAELEPLLPGRAHQLQPADENPFIGLAAFQASDAARFFGRDDDTASLVTRVRNHPLVAVVGPSGVGKSSLVRAGVIPALERSGEGWTTLLLRPGRSPLDTLVQAVYDLNDHNTSVSGLERPDDAALSHLSDSLASVLNDPGDLRERLHREPGLVGSALRAWSQRKQRRLLLFIDQFEEIYTVAEDPEERAAFLACLEGVADDPSSPLRLVFSLRSDFLERMAEDRSFMNRVISGLVVLAPMGRAALRQALVKPLEQVGYEFESQDMVDQMLDELEATPGALPLMQFTASHLWDARDRARKLLTQESYRHMGGIAGTLARHADQVLTGMTVDQVKLTRAIFERLITPERTRAIVSMTEIRALPWPTREISSVLDTLTRARLLVVETGNADVSGFSKHDAQRGKVEIVHESLITSWPTLSGWLDENQVDAEFRTRLRSAARQWQKGERAAGLLWRSTVAVEAQHWREQSTQPLSEPEEQYLDAVIGHASEAARRKRLVVYSVAAVMLALLVAAASAVWVAVEGNERYQALERENRALEDENELLEKRRAALEEKLGELIERFGSGTDQPPSPPPP